MQEKKLIKQFNLLLKNFSHYKNYKKIYPLRKKEDILKIPLTSRKDLFNWDIDKTPQTPMGLIVSSGSTGTPLIAFDSESNTLYHSKNTIYQYFKFVSAINKRIWFFARRQRIISFHSLLKILRKKEMKNTSLFFVGDEFFKDIKALETLFKKTKPEVLFVFPPDLDDILLLKKKLWASIKKIVNMGMPMTTEIIKKIKQKNKNIEIYNLYGCEEIGGLAIGKITSPYLWLIDDGVYIEILKDNGTFSETGKGEIIITDLYNFSTPIIRYRLGDEVEIKKIGNKKYIKILGRKDKFVKIQGKITSINSLIKVVRKIIGSQKFTIILTHKPKKIEDLLLIILPKEKISSSQKIEKDLRKEIKFVRFELIFDDSKIQKTESGLKYKNFIDLRNYNSN